MPTKDADVKFGDIIRVLAPGPDAMDGETVAQYFHRRRNRALRRLEADPSAAGDAGFAAYASTTRTRRRPALCWLVISRTLAPLPGIPGPIALKMSTIKRHRFAT